MQSSDGHHYVPSPRFLMAALQNNAVPDRRLVVSGKLGSSASTEDVEVSILDGRFKSRTWGWLHNKFGVGNAPHSWDGNAKVPDVGASRKKWFRWRSLRECVIAVPITLIASVCTPV
jgi:hypothetical protein